MATSAESSKQWLDEKTPSIEEVTSVIQKLESRIDSWKGDDDEIQGSIDAVLVLESHIESLQAPTHEAQDSVLLDNGQLIPEHQPIQLEKEVKEKTFAALKAQLGQTLSK